MEVTDNVQIFIFVGGGGDFVLFFDLWFVCLFFYFK